MDIIKRVYTAEVVLSVLNEKPISEQEIMEAAIDAEIRVNAIDPFEYAGSLVGVQLHLDWIKGEKNGDNQSQDMA